MKDKFFNILLVLLLVLLTLNLLAPKKPQTTLENTLSLKTQESYTVPAGVKVEVLNKTANDFTFHTCNNFQIKKDSKIITPEKCEEVTLKSTEVYTIDLSNEFSKFSDTGKYFASLKKDDVDIISQFEIEHRGFIGKFFIFFFYAPVYNLMAFLLEMTHYSLGWAIIIITIIIRLILLVPQHKMMVSQARMQKIQPKIKEIQDKHKGNHQMLGMELMKLYKDEKVNPM